MRYFILTPSEPERTMSDSVEPSQDVVVEEEKSTLPAEEEISLKKVSLDSTNLFDRGYRFWRQ